MSPFFSIIIPTYNRAQRISGALRSVLEQTFGDFELIVVDDGSTDDTSAVIRTFRDPRIRYIRTENRERAAARNTGAEMALGKFLSFLDSDDALDRDHLQTAHDALQNDPGTEWLHLKYRIEKKDKVVLPDYPGKDEPFEEKLFLGNYLSCQGVFLERSLAAKNRFNEARTLSGLEDWELWIRLSLSHRLKIADRITSALKDHSGRSVMSRDVSALLSRMNLFMELVLGNQELVKRYKPLLGKFRASCFSYIALHCALSRSNRNMTIRYTLRSLAADPGFLFSKRFLAILKHFF